MWRLFHFERYMEWLENPVENRSKLAMFPTVRHYMNWMDDANFTFYMFKPHEYIEAYGLEAFDNIFNNLLNKQYWIEACQAWQSV